MYPLLSRVCITWVTLSLYGYATLTFSLNKTTIQQGHVLKCLVTSSQPLHHPTIHLNNNEFKLFKAVRPGSAFYYDAYIGISKNIPATDHAFIIKGLDSNNQPIQASVRITVLPANFKSEAITLPPKKSSLPERTQQLRKEGALLSQQFKKTTPRTLTQQPFMKPTTGRISSSFGNNRTYQGRIQWQHSGVDIANRIGTPIRAANSGQVILSEELPIHGHTIMIDHGKGLVTIYNHLNSRSVTTGQWVYRGKKIGQMGQTGIATGPHLHWGFSVQNIRVDPMIWLTDSSVY